MVRIVRLAAVTVIALAAVLIPASAQAGPETTATCSGIGCNHKDPAVTGCDGNAVTADSQSTSRGTYELRFSTTCQTNWVRVRNYPGGGPRLWLYVRDVPTNTTVPYRVPNLSAGLHYGNMVFSPGSNCALGLVNFDSDPEWDVTLASSGC